MRVKRGTLGQTAYPIHARSWCQQVPNLCDASRCPLEGIDRSGSNERIANADTGTAGLRQGAQRR